MKIKQAKLAQGIKGETSNILTDSVYDMDFDKGMLNVVKKHNPNNLGPFIVFPANIAYLEVADVKPEALPVTEGKATKVKK